MIARLAIIFALQAAALAWMIHDRFTLLDSPTRATFETVPVDPMDLLRGEYVILSYPFSDVGRRMTDGNTCSDGPPLPAGLTSGDIAYVVLQDQGGTWAAAAIAETPPSLVGGQILLRGRVLRVNEWSPDGTAGCRSARLAYGIESFFVPQGSGRAIEAAQRGGRVTVEVAIAETGEAAIRSLAIDGNVVHSETLF